MNRPTKGPLALCSSCQAPIAWAVMPSGKPAPFDREPSVDGAYVILKKISGKLEAIRYDEKLHPTPPWRRYTNHFITCRSRDQHRKRGGPPQKVGELLPGEPDES